MSTAATADYTSIEVRSAEVARVRTKSRVTDRMHPGVIGIGVAAYAVLVSTLILGFAGPSDFMAPALIVIVCLTVFVAVPVWMGGGASKFWRRHGAGQVRTGSLREFLGSKFETDAGQSTGVGVLALVTTVPIALACGAIAFVIILNVVR